MEGDKGLQPCWFHVPLADMQASTSIHVPRLQEKGGEQDSRGSIQGYPPPCGASSQGAWPRHRALPPPPP